MPMTDFREKNYFTAIEYANMRLPGLPVTESGITRKAKKGHWEKRPREGRGGGWEYSTDSLPAKARMAFIERKLNLSATKIDKTATSKDPAKITPWQKKEADRKLGIVREYLQIEKDIPPKKRTEVKRKISKQNTMGYRTLDELISGFKRIGYQALIPEWNNGTHEPIITSEMGKFIEKNYLQPYGPPIKKVHEDLCKTFADKCLRLPAYRTVANFINQKWTVAQQLLVRDKDTWNKLYDPYVRRDWEKVELNELWISDHKQIDICCLYRGKAIFPWLTVIEEARSRKFIGWILVPTPNALSIGQAFLYGVSKYGPPKTFYVDRGRDYKSKYIAGKKEKRDINGDLIDPALPGLVANLGTEIFYAVGRNPREKIIESAFGIFTDRHKDLPGYRGHSIKTRPKKLNQEIKTKNLLTIDELSLKIDEIIHDRNARPHSTTRKTPDSYWEDYQAILPSQHLLDFLLMDVHEATVKDSSVLIKGLLYRGDELFKLAGERVSVRRDPKDIRRAVIIYRNEVFCSATLETPDHYRSEITLQSVSDAARIRKKIKKYRQEIIESEDVIDDPLKIAVELDQKEKLRVRDIRPSNSKVKGFHKHEKLARNVSDAMRKTDLEQDEYQEPNTAAAGGDILSRYLVATAGKSRPVGQLN
ncbi:MAG: DNA-binding protein [Smithellaceae bacterium]